MNTQTDAHNGLRWRNLTETEEKVLIGRYKERNKLIFFFYNIIFAIGVGMMLLCIIILPWQIYGSNTYEDILGNIVIVSTMGILFIAIPAIHYNIHFRKEMWAVKFKQVYICETKIIDMFEDKYTINNREQTVYNFTVELPYTLYAITVKGGKNLYESSLVGDAVYVVYLEKTTTDVYYAYPMDFTVGGYFWT